MSDQLSILDPRPSSQWKEFLLSLSSIFILAIGTGAFLFLIIAFLESQHVPVLLIGSVMSVFSFIQAIAVYLIGRYYPGTHFRAFIISALIIQSSGVFLLATLSTGWLMWIAVSLFGIGLGILLVVLYASAIQRRPYSIRAGVSIGIYTALVAGGNAVGAFLVGLFTDAYGYSAAFLFSGAFIFAVIFLVVFMADQVEERVPDQMEINRVSSPEEDKKPLALWKLGVVMAFLMAGLMSVFDTLLPVYGLRAGLAVSVVGALSGMKMFLAAASRPLIGYLLDKMDSQQVSKWGFTSMVLFAIIFPFSGLGTLLFVVTGLFGISFGAIRVASLTSALEGQTISKVITRRLSYYRLSMTFGQITGPYLAGLAATAIIVSDALIVLAIAYFALFVVCLLVFRQLSLHRYLPWIRRSSDKHLDR